MPLVPPFVQDPYRAIPAPKGVYRPVGTWMRGRMRGGHFDLETRNPIRPKKFALHKKREIHAIRNLVNDSLLLLSLIFFY